MADPIFVDNDFQTILAETVSTFETLSGETIPPASLVSILLRSLSYRETLIRILINETGKLNFITYARDEALDYIGDLVGVDRLTNQPAICEIQFTWTSATAVEFTIPAGTRIQSSDGLLIFAIDEDEIIPANSTSYNALATCTTSGIAGNDYAPGTINVLLDSIPITPASVANLADTENGADSEDDDHYRARIKLDSESNHGTVAHYKKLALSASTDIISVEVENVNPGEVGIYLICRDGDLPDSAIITLVENAIDDESEKTLCDTVIVEAATPVPYVIDVEIFFNIDTSALAASTLTEATRLITEWADVKKQTMGKDLVPEEIISLCQNLPGVYRVVVNSPSYTILAKKEVAQYSTISITSGGEVEP